MTAPSDDVDLREPSSCEKLAALQLRGDGLYTDASGSVFDADEYAEIRDAAKDEELADLRQQLATAQAARERAEGVVRETLWMAGRYADGRATYAVGQYNDARVIAEQGGFSGDAKPAVDGHDQEWATMAERLTAAESRLAKVGEIVESSFAKADEERLQETYKARDEAEKWKSEGDMYGWNFHQGMSSGTIGASIIYHRMKRELEAALKGE